MNLGNALDAPKEGEWGVVLKEEYFKGFIAAGFDSVRIPVRWSAHAETTAPFRIEPKFFDRVDWAIRQALRRRLTPVVNMHHYEEIFGQPQRHRQRFLALWRQIAEHYRDYPPMLVLELLNEPHDKLTAEKWNALAAEAIGVVRRSNPTRLIVVGPVGWNSIDSLESLELPKDDRRLVVTVHYYSRSISPTRAQAGLGRNRRSGWARSGPARQGRASGGRPRPGQGHRLGGEASSAVVLGRVRRLQQGRPGVARPLDSLCRRRGDQAKNGVRLLGVLLRVRRLRSETRAMDRAAPAGIAGRRSAVKS